MTREYIYYAPANLAPKAPLVMVLHGFTSNAERIMEYSGMNEIAKENGFAVVYPQGTKDKEGNTFLSNYSGRTHEYINSISRDGKVN